MSTPVASMARRAASLTSGPTPSPGISVIVCRAMHPYLRDHRPHRPPSLAEPRVDTIGAVWSDRLPSWYAANGRHHLPWRHTRDPWAVLLSGRHTGGPWTVTQSEGIVKQTSCGRVLERWGR